MFTISKKAQFDGLELIFDDNPETSDGELIRRLVKEFDVPVFSVHIPMGKCSVFGNKAANIVRRSFDIAQSVGATGLVIHPERNEDKRYERNVISVLQEYSADSSVTLFLENMPRRNFSSTTTPFYDPVYLSQLHTPLCLDTSHLATSHLDFSTVVSAVAENVGHVHFSDSTISADEHGVIQDEHLPVGRGTLPLGEVIWSLQKTGYRGAYCLELRPTLFRDMLVDNIILLLGELCGSARRLIA